ncbi:probable protein phosphatase 2C 55 isoform X3 [Cynara cardunculus var. scolymus]|uniref:probable protein phosphatase 2C 55 isoform X3 n=1 Tax=Cynara cardunculus var. scolymus TaxID=59895 RepID=UPI000D6286CB|nr:probable protein phosphatase 2C 55 isoform X3 [Cynara cardunculus var. scolymus]
MPSNYFSRLRGSFRQGIQRSYVVLEGSFLDSLEVLPVNGKLLFDKPAFYYRTFAAFSDLNILFQRGTPVAAQSNIQSASKKKNLSVVGAVSRTLSIPSVSGPPFQVCGYHVDNLLAGRSRFPLGIGSHKVPMSLSGSNALLGRYSLNNLTPRRGQLMVLNGRASTSHHQHVFLHVQPLMRPLTTLYVMITLQLLQTLMIGGWAELGIDAGIYARELMSNSLSAVLDEPTGSTDPARVLEKAHSSTKAKGSSTACIIALTDQGLSAINLGDSGFMVVRDGCTIFRSPAQQHNFNFTYQLENGRNGDLPSSGQVFTLPVAPGDVIVAGTDGLFDNLYNNDITAVVVHAVRAGLGPQVMAQKLAALAQQRAHEKDRQTPFSAAAQEAGFRYYGGKLDDITVVVSYITTSKEDESSSSSPT